MVALPKKWVKEMGLEQGSEVTISKVNSTSLLVNAQPQLSQGRGKEAAVTVSPHDSSETVFRKVVSLYVLGFSRIVIDSPKGFLNSSKKLEFKDLVRRHLIGTEGVVESRDRMTVHVLLGYSELSVENALKKMLLIIDSLGNDAVQAVESADPELAETTIERQDEVRRFGLYVIRQLNLSLNLGVLPDLSLENRDTLGYILVARILERIASHASTLAAAASELKSLGRPTVARLTSMSEAASSLVDDAMLSLFKRDHEGADATIEKAKDFVHKEGEVIRTLNGNDGQNYYSLHLVMDSQKRMAEYAKEIAEVVLDMTVERTLQEPELEIAQALYA